MHSVAVKASFTSILAECLGEALELMLCDFHTPAARSVGQISWGLSASQRSVACLLATFPTNSSIHHVQLPLIHSETCITKLVVSSLNYVSPSDALQESHVWARREERGMHAGAAQGWWGGRARARAERWKGEIVLLLRGRDANPPHPGGIGEDGEGVSDRYGEVCFLCC